MNPTEKIKAIQRILEVPDDGDFGKKSKAALDALISSADAPVAAPTSPVVIGGAEFDERTERNLATLHPKALPKFWEFMRLLITEMNDFLVVPKIISGTRTYAEQDALFAKRPQVTKARGGYSNHNFGIAIDIGLFKNGKYLEDSPLYAACGGIGKSIGLEWGGDWKSIKDEPHFEIKTGLTMAQKRARVAAGQSIL